jgi:hypothetical protein
LKGDSSVSEVRKPKGELSKDPKFAPVVFGDGATYYIQKPWVEIRPVFKDGAAIGTYRTLTNGHIVDGFLEAITDSDDPSVNLCAVASIAAIRLREQYDLTESDLDRILCLKAGEPSAWISDVIEIATGRRGSV